MRGTAMLVSLLGVGAVAAGVAAPAGGAAPRSAPLPRVSFELLSQQDVLDAGAITVTLRSRLRTRVGVGLSVREGQRTVRLGPTRALVLRSQGVRRVTFAVPPSARAVIEACDAPVVVVRVRVSRRRPREVVGPISTEPPRCGRFFSDDAVWNRSLPPDAALDPNSAAITATLRREVDPGSRGRPATINTTPFSTPVYTVSTHQPGISVALDQPAGAAPLLAERFASVPIPPGALPAAGSDGNLVVWQPATDRLWEFWQLRLTAEGWHARWGGRLDAVSRGPGHFSGDLAGWGATATSLPLVGGLATLSELRRGRIDHALAMAVPNPRARLFASPAQRTDGSSTAADAIPEGARFRLDPALDLEALRLDPVTLTLARAAQRFGIIVRDAASNVVLYAEDPSPLGQDPYPALFGGRPPQELLRRFPWEHLQLVRMDMHEEPSAEPGPLGCLPLGCR